MTTPSPHPTPPLQFPSHAHPRTWLLTSAASALGIAAARAVLAHGDDAILCVEPEELGLLIRARGVVNGSKPLFSGSNGLGAGQEAERAETFVRFVKEEVDADEEWRERCRVVGLDGRCESLLFWGAVVSRFWGFGRDTQGEGETGRIIGQCQAAIAEAVDTFGKIDILFCCSSEAVIGTVEELAASPRTLTLIREQFETNFFGPVNIIKAALPAMREKRVGHIIVMTGITSHLGTPGLGIYCASGWALEGFCDSLAYEVAPFNIKMTILQPNLEINVLTNKISSAPLMPAYSPLTHPAPLSRSIIGGLLDRLSPNPPSPPAHDSSSFTDGSLPSEHLPQALHSTEKVEVAYPSLPPEMKSALLAETIHALVAVGGHENPPGRHIVGFEAVASVKEKLKTVSEELEDFVELSAAVDIEEGGEGEVNGG
ncbi:hypothetical protein MMC11_004594 [Xylographa trunciseda]|nr:hypothetical protein [Xylographa trunciseda]